MKITHNIKLTSLILALGLLPAQTLLAACPCGSDLEDPQTVMQDKDKDNQDQDEQDINNADPDQ